MLYVQLLWFSFPEYHVTYIANLIVTLKIKYVLIIHCTPANLFIVYLIIHRQTDRRIFLRPQNVYVLRTITFISFVILMLKTKFRKNKKCVLRKHYHLYDIQLLPSFLIYLYSYFLFAYLMECTLVKACNKIYKTNICFG